MRRLTMVAGEKKFYLQSFRHRSLLVHVAAPHTARHVAKLVDELVENRTVVITVASKVPRSREAMDIALSRSDHMDEGLLALGAQLMSGGEAWIRKPGAMHTVRALDFSCRIAVRLGVHKLVVVDSRGGMGGPTGPRSFVHATSALRLAHGDADLGGWRASEIEKLVDTIRRGVESVNLTKPEDLEAELFTYRGAGTLITVDDYCRVSPLRVDDFAQANDLLDRGEAEGFLLARDARARARLMLSGYGAWFEGRLAGIAGLETELYRRERLAEVIGLYTITRFQGEGVGNRILDFLLGVAEEGGCRAVFACTANERAAEFFLRNGFDRVAASELPAEKWRHRRGRKPMAFLREV